MASLAVTYLLWIIGGFFGLHHLYLGRVNQAFVWFATLGGVFGLGWFRDLWRIPFYVKCRNGEKEWQEQHLTHMAIKNQPPCGLIRSMGMFAMGYLASVVVCGLLPPDYKDNEAEISMMTTVFYRVCSGVLIVAGSSMGVWVVANIGEIQCSFIYPLVGALLATPWLVASESNASVPTLFASLVAWYFGLQWRPLDLKSSPRRGFVNVLIFLAYISLWSAVFCYGVYHAEITVRNSERIPLRVVMRNFFASPAWYRIKESFYRIYVALRTDGWDSAFTDAVDVFDFSGEANALELLGLNKNTSQDVITKKCRKLSSLHHPDRHKTPAAKAEAEAKFLKIREACSVLTRKPYQRSRYN